MSIQQSAIKTREREFHNMRFGAVEDSRAKVRKYYSVLEDARICYKSLIAANVFHGARVLEYGCGTGEDLEFSRSLDCDFYGIDISPEAIKKAVARAEAAGFPARYAVGDAESTNFDCGFFDLVMGKAIIHHLDIDKAMAELGRITKPTGCCIFIEPLGHNPVVNLFRLLTPTLRSPDEHPLRERDIQILGRYFRGVEVSYFGFFSLAAIAFRGTRWCDIAFNRLSQLDRLFLKRFHWFRKYSWYSVIKVSCPLT